MRPSAVIDTNLLVSGLILKRGAPYELIEALRRGAFTMAIALQLWQEYEEVLPRRKFAERYGLTQEEVADFLFLIASSARRVTPWSPLPIALRDAKDQEVLAAGLGLARETAGAVVYLVTGDADLLEHQRDPRLGTLRIVTVHEFLQRLWQGLGSEQR